jgi:hypothetical protein
MIQTSMARTRRAQTQLMAQRAIHVPNQIRPCQFGELGAKIAVRRPVELAHILRRVGAICEPGRERWLVQRRRIGPVIRALERATDPLFRRAGVVLDCERGEAPPSRIQPLTTRQLRMRDR